MDILQFITSINKISALAFVATLALLIYEVRQLKKTTKKQIKSQLPKFDDQKKTAFMPIIPVIPQQTLSVTTVEKKTNHRLMIASVIGGVISLGFISVIGITSFSQNSRASQTGSNASPSEVKSIGLKFFSLSWKELTPAQVGKLEKGTTMYIGIAAIPVKGIDKARIRVNEQSWRLEHETALLSPNGSVYYKEYTIATADARLKIDAQFHSVTEGWLGN